MKTEIEKKRKKNVCACAFLLTTRKKPDFFCLLDHHVGANPEGGDKDIHCVSDAEIFYI
jgi:hypothetical protein